MPILDLIPDAVLSAWPRSGKLIILDLEYTSWDGSLSRGWGEPWEWREVVHVGALLVDGEAFGPLDSYETLVRPARNPQLSDYFQALTGIRQEAVDSRGTTFERMLAEIVPFLKMGDLTIFNGADGQILRENCALYDIAPTFEREKLYNFRPLLASSLGRRPSELTSSGLPALAGIEMDLQAHSALADCRAIAASLAHWRGERLV